MPANPIASELQVNTFLNSALTAFKSAILPLTAFSIAFRDVVLNGTNKMAVPYYPLEAAASKDFVAATGYEFDQGTTNGREITVNKRKYQSLSFTSDEFRRQPAFDPEKLGEMKGQKLAEDVLADVLSVVTLANYGAAAVTSPSATFDIEQVIDLRQACETAKWPKAMRSLILNSAYDAALLKDTNIRAANQLGDNSAIRQGNVGQLVGFDYYNSELIPANGENLVGMAAYPSAILIGFSPIEPAPEVMDKLTVYEVVTDPNSNLTLEYRVWGDPDKDTAKRVIEVNYGYAKGEAAAIKRIVSA